MVVLDEVKATVVLVVIQDNEKLPQFTTVIFSDDHEDLGQVLVREVAGQVGHGLDEVHGPRARVRGLRRWIDGEHRTRLIAPELVAGPRGAGLVVLSELTHDGDSDLRVESYLVSDTDRLKAGRLLDGVLVPEKTRKNLTDADASLNGADLNVVQRGPGQALAPWIDHQQHVNVQIGLGDLKDETKKIPNLALGRDLPLLLSEIAEPWQITDGEPVRLGPVEDPVGELGVDGDLALQAAGKLRQTMLEIGQAIIMIPRGLLIG